MCRLYLVLKQFTDLTYWTSRTADMLVLRLSKEIDKIHITEDMIKNVKHILLSVLPTASQRTEAKLKHVCWLLAGNAENLIKGHPVNVWDKRKGVWTYLFVDDIVRSAVKEPRYDVIFYSIAGPSAGMSISGMYSYGWLNNLLYKIAVPRFNEDFPKVSILDLGGMFFVAWLEASPSIKMLVTECSPSQKIYNKTLVRDRAEKCIGPAKKDRCIYCRYGRDVCAYARHAYTMPYGQCRNSSILHYGTLTKSGYCVNCMERGVMSFLHETKGFEDV